MRAGKVLLSGSVIAVAAISFGTPAPAQQNAVAPAPQVQGPSPDAQTRERDTNRALLNALLARRAEIANARRAAEVSAERSAQARSYALEFLDRQIAAVRSRMGE